VPRGLRALALRVDKKVLELSTDLHTASPPWRRSRATEEEVLEALQASGACRATSLEAPRDTEDDAGDTLGDTVASTEQGFGMAEARATLALLLRAVTPREREVLRLYFEEDLTHRQIDERIGVSQMRSRASSANRSPACRRPHAPEKLLGRQHPHVTDKTTRVRPSFAAPSRERDYCAS
jgi:RNA polymerase sigma-B factor